MRLSCKKNYIIWASISWDITLTSFCANIVFICVLTNLLQTAINSGNQWPWKERSDIMMKIMTMKTFCQMQLGWRLTNKDKDRDTFNTPFCVIQVEENDFKWTYFIFKHYMRWKEAILGLWQVKLINNDWSIISVVRNGMDYKKFVWMTLFITLTMVTKVSQFY